MTLYLRILSAQGLLQRKIYINGSQAGALVATYNSKNQTWDNKYDIHCSGQDQLIFKICGHSSTLKDQPLIATAKFHSPSMVKAYGDKLNMQEPFLYHIDAYTKDEKQAGTIKMQIKYDKSLRYMGQLNGLEKQQVQPSSYLPLYRGKYGKADGQQDQFRFVESIYRDQ